jgi:hypothetical protein
MDWIGLFSRVPGGACSSFLGVVVLAAMFGCAREPAPLATFAPEQLQGLSRVQLVEGEQAARDIARLHEQSVAPQESIIASYGPPAGQAVLYVSRFFSKEEAQEQLNRMAERMEHGAAGFSPHQRAEMAGLAVYFSQGHGQAHYFYAEDDRLVWLAVDAARARPSLALLLGLDLESVAIGP